MLLSPAFHAHCPTLAAFQSSTIAHLFTIILASIFPSRYHGYYYSMSSVGVSAPPRILPHSRGETRQLSPHVGLLFYLGSPELIALPSKTLTSPVLLYTFWSLEAIEPTTGDPCHPTRYITRFLTVHTRSFLSDFSQISAPSYHMACHFRVNSFTLGICLYIFPSHVCRFSCPSISHPSTLPFDPCPLRFSGPDCLDSRLRTW